jgi:hypothetical protein
MNAGAFRPFFYTARYSDGYQEDVTDQVALSTQDTSYLTIVDNQVKVNPGTPSGDYHVTGVYSDGETTLTATSVVSALVQGTAWDRFAVTGGGDGLSSAYSRTRPAWRWGLVPGESVSTAWEPFPVNMPWSGRLSPMRERCVAWPSAAMPNW